MGYFSFEKGIEERVDKREKIGFCRLYRRVRDVIPYKEGQGPTRTAQVDRWDRLTPDKGMKIRVFSTPLSTPRGTRPIG